MTLTKSCNNGFRQWWSFYTWSLKKQSGIGIIYLLLLCLALPFLLGIILFSAVKNEYQIDTGSISNYFNGLFTVLIVPGTLLFVLITSIMLFRYMHNKRSTDFYHALPVSRNAMFLGRYAAGLTILAVPMILCCCITAIVLAIMQGFANIIAIPYGTLFLYMAYLLLIIAATYTFTTFIAICSGTTFNMIVSIVAITFSYPLLTWLLFTTVDFLLPGFSYMHGYASVLTAGTPYIAAFLPMLFIDQSHPGAANYGEGITYISWWICVTVVLFIAAFFLYRFRKSENAEGRKAYPIPQIIIRTMVSGAIGIGFGYILYALIGSTVTFFIGLVLGAVIAHVVIEVLYARGFKTLLKSTPYLAGFFVLYGIFYAILATGCFGYDTKVPLASQVESVDVDIDNIPKTEILDGNGKTIASIMPINLEDKDTISAAIQWHQDIVDRNREEQFPYVFSNYRYDGQVNYHLKDGSTLKREVEISQGPAFLSNYLIKNMDKPFKSKMELEQQEEFIKKSNLIFYLEPAAFNTVKVSMGQEPSSYVEADGQKEMLLQMLQQDILRNKEQQAGKAMEAGYEIPIGNNSEEESESNDPNAVALTIDLKAFTPSQNDYVHELIGDYTGNIQFSTSHLTFTISPEKYPNTHQYLLDNGFIKKA